MQESCRICGDSEFYLQAKGAQIGVYCANCGKWMKWLSKKDQVIYKNKGFKIYPQNVEVKLKGNFARGVSVTPINSNMGFEDSATPTYIPSMEIPVNKVDRPSNNPKIPSEAEIERYISQEVEKRVKAQVEKIKEEQSFGDDSVDEGYCPVCDGSPLQSDNINNVEVCIFSGTLSVTNKEGSQVLGLYKLKRCPNCGRRF